MITIRNIHKSFGSQTLFEDASLQINQGDRYALVGPNGAGKSTLFKMLLSEMEPDSGEIQWRRGVTVGYLPQETENASENTVLAETLSDHEDPDGKVTAKAKTVLMGLGFRISDFERPVNTLSGGWAMRVAMARLLIEQPDLLMLDEPTNHLDLESLIWFQNYLVYYPGAIFLISHDRSFINTLCRSIVSLEARALKVYHGNYDYFLREREAERARIEAAYKRQQEEIADMTDFINKNRARASTASRAQSMIKRLEKLELIELPEETRSMKIKFPQPERTGARVLQLKNVYKSYGDVKVYEGLDFELDRGQKIAFVGHNGAGKSTLLKVLAGVIPIDSGEKILGLNVKVGYFSQHRTAMLDAQRTVLQEALATERDNSEQTVRSVLGSFLFTGQSVFKKVEVLSGGEKTRLALVKLLLDPPNVLLMDEPTTHLDMRSVDALIEALKDFEGTVCFISHDLYMINALANHIVHVDKGKITVYPGNYEYFMRRQEQSQIAEGEGAEAEHAPAHHVPDSKPKQDGPRSDVSVGVPLSGNDKRREERKKRAQERKAQEDIQRIEEELEDRRARLEKLTADLQDPAIYNDYASVQSITQDLKEVQSVIEAKEKELSKLKANVAEPS